MGDIDFEQARKLKLNDTAFDAAIEAATAEHVAFDDPSRELEIAIKTYLYVRRQQWNPMNVLARCVSAVSRILKR